RAPSARAAGRRARARAPGCPRTPTTGCRASGPGRWARAAAPATPGRPPRAGNRETRARRRDRRPAATWDAAARRRRAAPAPRPPNADCRLPGLLPVQHVRAHEDDALLRVMVAAGVLFGVFADDAAVRNRAILVDDGLADAAVGPDRRARQRERAGEPRALLYV